MEAEFTHPPYPVSTILGQLEYRVSSVEISGVYIRRLSVAAKARIIVRIKLTGHITNAREGPFVRLTLSVTAVLCGGTVAVI